MRSVNTNSGLEWVSGSTTRMSTTAAAPTTCHHTEMLLRIAMRCARKMLSSVTSTSTTTNMRKTRDSE